MLDHEAQAAIRNRERPEGDVYPTPQWLAKAALQHIEPSYGGRFRVLDAGAGSGVWGTTAKALWPESVITGVEQRDLAMPAGFDYWYNRQDFLSFEPIQRNHAIIGNPPYNLAEAFLDKALSIVTPYDGQVFFLLRLQFLGGQGRALSLFKRNPPYKVTIIPKRPSFSGNNKTDSIEYAMFEWRKPRPKGFTQLDWLQIPLEIMEPRFRAMVDGND